MHTHTKWIEFPISQSNGVDAKMCWVCALSWEWLTSDWAPFKISLKWKTQENIERSGMGVPLVAMFSREIALWLNFVLGIDLLFALTPLVRSEGLDKNEYDWEMWFFLKSLLKRRFELKPHLILKFRGGKLWQRSGLVVVVWYWLWGLVLIWKQLLFWKIMELSILNLMPLCQLEEKLVPQQEVLRFDLQPRGEHNNDGMVWLVPMILLTMPISRGDSHECLGSGSRR